MQRILNSNAFFCSVLKPISSQIANSCTGISTSCLYRSKLDFEAFEDSIDRTTIELGSRSPNAHPLMLTGYGVNVFRFGKVYIKGSLAILDKAIFKWKITKPEDITLASLAMFHMVYPKLDILVIGTGNNYYPIQPSIITEMKERGVAVEVQDTKHACGTYNLLKGERPELVAAVLIPVTSAPEQKMIHKGTRTAIE